MQGTAIVDDVLHQDYQECSEDKFGVMGGGGITGYRVEKVHDVKFLLKLFFNNFVFRFYFMTLN